MKKYFLFLLLSVTAALHSDTVDELMQQAKEKYKSGNSQYAILILDLAVSANPENKQAKKLLADICVDIGESEYAKKNYKNAYVYFKKAVIAYPSHKIAAVKYWKMKNDFDVANLTNEGGNKPDKMADKKLYEKSISEKENISK